MSFSYSHFIVFPSTCSLPLQVRRSVRPLLDQKLTQTLSSTMASLLCRRMAALSVNQQSAIRTKCSLSISQSSLGIERTIAAASAPSVHAAAAGGSLPHVLMASGVPTQQPQPPQQQQVRTFARRSAAARTEDGEKEKVDTNINKLGAPRISTDQIPRPSSGSYRRSRHPPSFGSASRGFERTWGPRRISATRRGG